MFPLSFIILSPLFFFYYSKRFFNFIFSKKPLSFHLFYCLSTLYFIYLHLIFIISLVLLTLSLVCSFLIFEV